MDQSAFTIGITVGDLNGIGIEVILKTLDDNRILNHCIPVIYGSSKAVSYYRKMFDLERINYHIIDNIEHHRDNTINIINCWQEEVNITPGEYDETMGKYALMALDQASADLRDGKINALVTGPVNKHNIQKQAPDFRGQTEYLEQKIMMGKSMMILASDRLIMGLVTTHIPIRNVADAITSELVGSRIKQLNDALRKDFLIQKPRIAILGLNPHAGDGGLLGNEDEEIIQPAIEKARENNILAFGPYAADGFFGSGNYEKFDGILAMYHDQGLVAFKALSFGSGVNYTAGLPVVRTSPDHGTAYEIAGKGIANEESFRAALFMALDIAANRTDHAEMHRNPLKRGQLAEERN